MTYFLSNGAGYCVKNGLLCKIAFYVQESSFWWLRVLKGKNCQVSWNNWEQAIKWGTLFYLQLWPDKLSIGEQQHPVLQNKLLVCGGLGTELPFPTTSFPPLPAPPSGNKPSHMEQGPIPIVWFPWLLSLRNEASFKLFTEGERWKSVSVAWLQQIAVAASLPSTKWLKQRSQVSLPHPLTGNLHFLNLPNKINLVWPLSGLHTLVKLGSGNWPCPCIFWNAEAFELFASYKIALCYVPLPLPSYLVWTDESLVSQATPFAERGRDWSCCNYQVVAEERNDRT